MAENKRVGQLKKDGCFEMSIDWKIVDFVFLPQEVDTFHESPLFHFLNKTWCLRIYPNGRAEGASKGCIELYLVIKGSAPSGHVTYTFFLKRSDGVKVALLCGKNMLGKFPDNFGRVFPRSHLFNRKSELLPSNTLTVICTMKYVSETAEVTEPVVYEVPNDQMEASSQTEATDCIDKLQEEFKELLLSAKNSDITLIVKGKEFAVHSNILAARSPVFSAMMEHEMKEKNAGKIEIEDSDPDTFPDFLQYLYTARLESLTSEKALYLYTTADKYQVNELKSACLEYMLANISVENFCGFLVLSLRHREKELLDVITQYFIKNSLEIVMTPKWQIFLGENLVEGNELLIKTFRVNK